MGEKRGRYIGDGTGGGEGEEGVEERGDGGEGVEERRVVSYLRIAQKRVGKHLCSRGMIFCTFSCTPAPARDTQRKS